MKENEIQIEGNGNIIIQDVLDSSIVINATKERHLQYLKDNHPEIFNTIIEKLEDLGKSENNRYWHSEEPENQSTVLQKIKSFFSISKSPTVLMSGGDLIYSGGNTTINQEKKFRAAELKIVDISINQTEGSPLPILDVKVRNNSDEVVFIKYVELVCIKRWIITNLPNFSLVPVSWTYDITVPEEGRKLLYPLSQEVKANETDRFELRLRTNHGAVPGVGVSPHLLKLKLIFNEDDKSIESKNIMVHIPSYTTWAGMINRGMSPEQLKEMIEIAKDILNHVDADTINQSNMLEVVRDWANIKQ